MDGLLAFGISTQRNEVPFLSRFENSAGCVVGYTESEDRVESESNLDLRLMDAHITVE
jgi:hypothetical protein